MFYLSKVFLPQLNKSNIPLYFIAKKYKGYKYKYFFFYFFFFYRGQSVKGAWNDKKANFILRWIVPAQIHRN